MRLNAKQIAQITGADIVVDPLGTKELACSLTWDSREVVPDALYVALPGQRVDGHDFVDSALRLGASLALVMKNPSEQTCALARELGAGILEVPDTADAITQLAAAWRLKLSGCVIGLTGSSGKTTTKNLVRDVLAVQHSVVATKANQNNELGVPKTLLSAAADTEYVVVEMGMRGQGQIHELCSFVQPDMGLIVNVGESHIELLGGRDNIARAKGELFCELPSHKGVAFVNAGGDYADFLCENAHLAARDVRVVRFGLQAAPEDNAPAVWAENIHLDEEGRPCFVLCAQGFTQLQRGETHVPVSLNLRGLHNVSNATAAAAVGLQCGMALETIASALQAALPEAGRQEVVKARAGYTIVNDTYNANPESMRASLLTFSAMDGFGRHIAVLGDMGELGSYAEACHKGIGALIPSLNVDYLICIGELSAYIAQAALEAGMSADRIVQANSISDVLGTLDSMLEPTDAVLVKASHFMGLSRVVEGLIR